MDVVSACDLPATAVRWMSASGAPALTVVCRATFTLQPILSRLADAQEAIVAADVHWDDDPRRGLRVASDLVPYKARADVVVVGHAFAPKGNPARTVVARLVVGALDKSVEVATDRPMGRDGDVHFGPIAPGWPQRAARSPRLGARWASALAADRPLPEDPDPAFFNCAPPDQQIDAIRADERIVLEHLHPSHARVITSLPGIVPRATIVRVGQPPRPLAMVCDTLWIDTDRAVCALVFRGTVPLAYPREPGCITVIAEVPDTANDMETDRTMAPPSQVSRVASVPFPVAPTRPEAPQARLSSTGLGLPFQASPPALATPPLATPPLAAPPLATPPLAASPLAAPPLAAPPPVTPPLATPLHATPPLVAPPLAISPVHTGSIGQRLAVEQGMMDADVMRRARAGSEVPRMGPLAAVPEPEPLSPSAETPEPAAAASVDVPPGELDIEEGREVIAGVWSESDLPGALRREPRWRETIEQIESEIEGDEDAPPVTLGEEDPDLWVSLLARGEPASVAEMRAALAAAVRSDGRLVHPVAVAEGVLTCSFDERERLRVLAAAALAMEPGDEALDRAVGAARGALSEPSLPGALAVRLAISVRAAFASGERGLSVRELDALVERALLEQRAYARREVLAGAHVRAELAIAGEPAIVAYLPEECARALPLVRAMRARLLVEVRAREDEREASLLSLRVRALVRIHRIPIN